MIVTWNNRTNLPEVKFEKTDYANANQVRTLLAGEHTCRKCGNKSELNAWKVMEGYFASMRLSIEEIGKAHARSRAKKELCSNDFSILDGFDIAVGMPRKIILQAEVLKEVEKKAREAENATTTDDDE